MILEVLFILVLVFSGAAILRPLGMRGWSLLPLGFIAGLVLFVVITYLHTIAGLVEPRFQTKIPMWSVLPIVSTFFLSGLWCLYKWHTGSDVRLNLVASTLALIAIVLLVIVIGEANLVKYHYDSLRYLITGAMIAGGNVDSLSMNLLTKRFSSVSIMHYPSNFSGSYYLRSITPLIGLSTLATLWWLSKEGLKKVTPRRSLLVFSVLGVLLLATNHGFVWHSFYINGHLLFGVLMLLTVGIGWLLARNDARVPAAALVALQALSVSGLVLTRPEGVFFACLAILPLLLSGKFRNSHKAALLVAVGGSVLLQQGVVMLVLSGLGRDIPSSAIGIVVLGVGVLLATPLLKWKSILKKSKHILWLTEAGLWAIVLLFYLKEPSITTDSIDATIENILFGEGTWGWSIVAMALFTTVLLLSRRFSYQAMIRFPITTFLPAALIMANLRGIAYRVGTTDSLNRMFMQVVPLIILFIVVSAASGKWVGWLNKLMLTPSEKTKQQ